MLNLVISVLCFTINIRYTGSQVTVNYDRTVPQFGYHFLPENILSRQGQANLVPISYIRKKLQSSDQSENTIYPIISKYPQKQQTVLITSKKAQNPHENRRYKLVYRKTYKIRQNGLDANNRSTNYTNKSKYGHNIDNMQAINRTSGNTTYNSIIVKTDLNRNDLADSNKLLRKLLMRNADNAKNSYYFAERNINSKEGFNEDKTLTIVKPIYEPYKYINHPVRRVGNLLEVANKNNDMKEESIHIANATNNSFGNINLNENLLHQVLNLQNISNRNKHHNLNITSNPISYSGRSQIQNDVIFVKQTNLKPESIDRFTLNGNDYETSSNDHELSFQNFIGKYLNSKNVANNDSIFSKYNTDNRQSLHINNIKDIDLPALKHKTVIGDSYDGNSRLNAENLANLKLFPLIDAGKYAILNDSNNHIMKTLNAKSTDNVELVDFAPNTVSNEDKEVTNEAIHLEQQTLSRPTSASSEDRPNSDWHTDYAEMLHESEEMPVTNREPENDVNFVSAESRKSIGAFDNVVHRKKNYQPRLTDKKHGTKMLNTRYLNENGNSLNQITEYVSENTNMTVDPKELQDVDDNDVTSVNFYKDPENILSNVTKPEELVKEILTAKNTETNVQQTVDWFRKYFSTVCHDIHQNISECWLTLSNMSHLNPKNPVDEKALLIFKLLMKQNIAEQLNGLDYVLQKLTCNKNNDDLSKYRRQLKPKTVTVLSTENNGDERFVTPEPVNNETKITTVTENKDIDFDELNVDNTPITHNVNVNTHTFKPIWKMYHDKSINENNDLAPVFERSIKIPNNGELSEYNSDIFYDNLYQYNNKPVEHMTDEDVKYNFHLQPGHDKAMEMIRKRPNKSSNASDITLLNIIQRERGEKYNNSDYLQYEDVFPEYVKVTKDAYNLKVAKKYFNELNSMPSKANPSEVPLYKKIFDLHFPVNNTNDFDYSEHQKVSSENVKVTKEVYDLKAGTDTNDQDKENYSIAIDSIHSEVNTPVKHLPEKVSDIHFPVDKVVINKAETNSRRKSNTALVADNMGDDILTTTRLSNENNNDDVTNEGVLPEIMHNVRKNPHFSEYLPDLRSRVPLNVIEETYPELYEQKNSVDSVHQTYMWPSNRTSIQNGETTYSQRPEIPTNNTNSIKKQSDEHKIFKQYAFNPLNRKLQTEFVKSMETSSMPFDIENMMNDSVIVRVNNLIMKTILQLKRMGIIDIHLENFIDVVQNVIMPSVLYEAKACQERAYFNFVNKLQHLVTTYTSKTNKDRGIVRSV